MEPIAPASHLYGLSPWPRRAETPLLAILSVLSCLLFLAGTTVSCGNADPLSCEKTVTSTIFLPDILIASEYPTKAAYAGYGDIARLDVFVFNDDEIRRLDSYCSFDNPDSPYISVNSSAGDKLVVVLANCIGHSFTADEFRSYDTLGEVSWRLEDEDPARPVMSGECQISAGAAGYTPIQLTPLLADICLDHLKVDFSGRGYRSRTLENCRVFLTNLSGSCEVLRKDGFRITELENAGAPDPDYLARMKHPEMVSRSVVPGYWAPVDLHCYPNDSATDGPGNPRTRMVVQGDIDGETYYYPVDINQDGFGYSSGPHGISRNVKYSYNLLITRKGSTDPDTPVGPEQVIGEAYIKLFPGQYITGTNGERIHVWVEVNPEDTPVYISRDDLDFDVERGIYTYEMDPGGHGVTLTLKDNGTGMFTIDAGPPVNDGFLVIVVVNP